MLVERLLRGLRLRTRLQPHTTKADGLLVSFSLRRKTGDYVPTLAYQIAEKIPLVEGGAGRIDLGLKND